MEEEMKKVHDKAIELGDMIYASPPSKRLEKATHNYLDHPEAVKELDEFKTYQRRMVREAELGKLSRTKMAEVEKKMDEWEVELKKNPVISELMNAEVEYNREVNAVLETVRISLMGQHEKQQEKEEDE